MVRSCVVIEGSFGPQGEWSVECVVAFPQFRATKVVVPFLVDPARPRSALSPELRLSVMALDELMDLPALQWDEAQPGGRAWEIPAFVTVIGDGARWTYHVPLLIPTAPNPPGPSRLGRDVLDRWLMVADPTEGTLLFEPRTWDLRLEDA